MKNRWRLLFIVLAAVVLVGWCGGYLQAEDHAKPRSNDDRRGDSHHRQPRAGSAGEQYHWRDYKNRGQHEHDRFPRHYGGPSVFGGLSYRGHPFGPHDRLWYYDEPAWRLFYWPYAYAPFYDCGWYDVPTNRRLVRDRNSDLEFWEYTDYRRIRLCFR